MTDRLVLSDGFEGVAGMIVDLVLKASRDLGSQEITSNLRELQAGPRYSPRQGVA